MSDDEHVDEGKSEARVRMEQDAKRRKERAEEEWKEYEEFRREERAKEEQEIQELRERRETRKKEREEEEKRLAEQRAIEEQKRKSEEEERQRKKREEEQKRREEREAKRAANEERSKSENRPNFVINKKAGGGPVEEEKKEEVTKTKEQLEAERKAVLEQRIQPLSIDGLKGDQLRSKAKELHELIMRLEGDKYDLEQRFTRQNYEMQEMAERARQMNKGAKTKTVQNEPDPLASKFSGLPPKIVMYSEYERIKDHRSFVDRKDVFGGPLYGEEYHRVCPTSKVVMTDTGFKVQEGDEAPVEAAEE